MLHFKPNLFIPGAAKSGTTSLHNLLNNAAKSFGNQKQRWIDKPMHKRVKITILNLSKIHSSRSKNPSEIKEGRFLDRFGRRIAHRSAPGCSGPLEGLRF